jgi:hypothetical protein
VRKFQVAGIEQIIWQVHLADTFVSWRRGCVSDLVESVLDRFEGGRYRVFQFILSEIVLWLAKIAICC